MKIKFIKYEEFFIYLNYNLIILIIFIIINRIISEKLKFLNIIDKINDGMCQYLIIIILIIIFDIADLMYF